MRAPPWEALGYGETASALDAKGEADDIDTLPLPVALDLSFSLTKPSNSPRLGSFPLPSLRRIKPIQPGLPPMGGGRVSGPRGGMRGRRESELDARKAVAALEEEPGAFRNASTGGRAGRDAERDVERSRFGAAPDECLRPRSERARSLEVARLSVRVLSDAR